MRNVYKGLLGKSKEALLGRCRWKDYIKVGCKEIV
jgi:hypothetical protein